MQSHSPRCRNCTHTTADVGSLRAHVHTHVHTDSERHEAYTRATSACLGVHATQGSRVSTGPHGCASNAHRRAVQQDGPCMLSPPSLASGPLCPSGASASSMLLCGSNVHTHGKPSEQDPAPRSRSAARAVLSVRAGRRACACPADSQLQGLGPAGTGAGGGAQAAQEAGECP